MIVPSRAALLGVLTVAPLLLSTKGDCLTDIDSDEFQAFQYATESTMDPNSLPQMCLDLGGDIFAYTGTATCDGETEDFADELNCLPSSCTSADPETLASAVAWLNAPDDAVDCTGEFTYEAIGEGFPSSMQCILDQFVMSMDSNIQAFFMASEVFEPNDPMLPNFCEGLDGDVDYDFLTYTATETCEGDFSSEEVTNAACVPSSCTGNETLLEIIIKENSEDDEDDEDGGEDDGFFGNDDGGFFGNSTDDFFGNNSTDDTRTDDDGTGDFFGNFTDDTRTDDGFNDYYDNDHCELNDFTFQGLQQDDTVSGDENYEDFVQCFTEASGESFNSLMNSLGGFNDVAQIGNACEGAGFDMIYFGGKLTCDGNVVADVNHIFSPICFPSACTSNEEVLKTIAGSRLFGDAKDSFEDDQCVEEFTFEHVGAGFVANALGQCAADFEEGAGDPNFMSFFFAFFFAGMADEPDYSDLPELCTMIDGFDYFTVSGTKTCSDGSIETLVDVPNCYPQSCSSMEENVLSQLLAGSDEDSEEDIVCLMSDVSYVGIDAPTTPSPTPSPEQTAPTPSPVSSSASSHGGLVAIILLLASAMTML